MVTKNSGVWFYPSRLGHGPSKGSKNSLNCSEKRGARLGGWVETSYRRLMSNILYITQSIPNIKQIMLLIKQLFIFICMFRRIKLFFTLK